MEDLARLRVKELTEICRNFGVCASAVSVYTGSDLTRSLCCIALLCWPGIRTSGRKAELVERIKANAMYQADVAKMAKLGISNGHHGVYSGAKRGSTDHVSGL